MTGLGTLHAAWPRPSRAHDSGVPSPSTVRIAKLGAWLAREDPTLAASLAREVESALPFWLQLAPVDRRVLAARRLCLHPTRISRDLDRQCVIPLDGWILARSEVALAAYLHGLSVKAQRA